MYCGINRRADYYLFSVAIPSEKRRHINQYKLFVNQDGEESEWYSEQSQAHANVRKIQATEEESQEET